MTSKFQHYPPKPQCKECSNAQIILCNAHDSATSFLDIFNSVRTTRRARGMPTDEEQDLLRAMLTVAAAGLDSMLKQLIRDALAKIIHREPGATAAFKRFVERRLTSTVELNRVFLADILADCDPQQRLIQALIDDLTGQSLQSTEQLFRAASFFDIPSAKLHSRPAHLSAIFSIRNEISHEMDVDFSKPNRSRRPRAKEAMVEHTNNLFKIAALLISEVDKKCASNN